MSIELQPRFTMRAQLPAVPHSKICIMILPTLFNISREMLRPGVEMRTTQYITIPPSSPCPLQSGYPDSHGTAVPIQLPEVLVQAIAIFHAFQFHLIVTIPDIYTIVRILILLHMYDIPINYPNQLYEGFVSS